MSSSEGNVAGLVLAAGSSTRMGAQNKLLLPLGQQSVVQRAVSTLIEAGLRPVRVVLGHDAERVQQELAGLPCSTVVNPEHQRGIKTSLARGINSLCEPVDAAVVMLADMPFVTVGMVQALLLAFRRTGAPLVASRYGDVFAPPTLYAKELFFEFRPPAPERCGKALLAAYQDRVHVVQQPEQALMDVDTAADLEQAKHRLVLD